MASRGSRAWLFQFVRQNTRSPEHLLCLKRINIFSDYKLGLESISILLEDEILFKDVVPHLPTHPELFAQVRNLKLDSRFVSAKEHFFF
jgi:hypothetical protein